MEGTTFAVYIVLNGIECLRSHQMCIELSAQLSPPSQWSHKTGRSNEYWVRGGILFDFHLVPKHPKSCSSCRRGNCAWNLLHLFTICGPYELKILCDPPPHPIEFCTLLIEFIATVAISFIGNNVCGDSLSVQSTAVHSVLTLCFGLLRDWSVSSPWQPPRPSSFPLDKTVKKGGWPSGNRKENC